MKCPSHRRKVANLVPGKNSTGERLGPPLIELVRYSKGEPNGLESTENRRSVVGMEINMYMCATRK